MQSVTLEMFDALCDLTRAQQSPSREAARLVLVEGRTVGEAARTAGLSYNAAYQAVERYRGNFKLALKAAGVIPK